MCERTPKLKPKSRVGYKSVIDFGRDARVYPPHDMCDYPTKILPQVMGEFVERLSAVGELVLDPFAGSGTVAVECAVRHRRSINIDINPYALEVTQKKLAALLVVKNRPVRYRPRLKLKLAAMRERDLGDEAWCKERGG
jgi:DNA modification methylase